MPGAVGTPPLSINIPSPRIFSNKKENVEIGHFMEQMSQKKENGNGKSSVIATISK
jgi:hypothetical protein